MLRKFLAILLVVTIAATSFIALETTHRPTTAHAQTADKVWLRLVNAIPGADLVDVYVDGNLVAPSLSFATATPHIAFPAGSHTVAVREARADATSPAIFEGIPTVATSGDSFTYFTVVLQSDTEGAVQAVAYADDLNPLGLGLGRIHTINASSEVGPISVMDRIGGSEVSVDVQFGVAGGSVNAPALGFDFAVITPGTVTSPQELAEIGAVNVMTNALYTFVVLGTATDLQVLQLMTPVLPDSARDTVSVAVAHGSADSSAFDVYADDTLIIPNLQPGAITPHVALPEGDITLAVRPAGSANNSDAAFSDTVNLGSSTGALTIAALGSLTDGSFNFSLVGDDISDIQPHRARFTVLNTNPNGVTSVDLSDGANLADALDPFTFSDPVDVDAGRYAVRGTTDSSDGPISFEIPEQIFPGGTYYTVLVFLTEDASANIGATAYNVDNTSLPGSVISVVVVENTPAPTTVEITPGATQLPTEVVIEPTAIPETGLTTAVPTLEVTTAPLPPATTAVPTINNITGVVNLNQGANLQCREYPTSVAFSLGLIPNGTTLIVRGYAGPVDLEIEGGSPTTPLEEGAFETPKEEIEEFSEIWVSAQWAKPEGGSLNCWTRADFLIMTYKNRSVSTPVDFFAYELVEIIPKILRMIPANIPGGASDEDLIVPPTPVRNDPIATVNVNAGVNLHIRQLPDSNALSLGLIGNGTSVFVLSRAETTVSTDVGAPQVPDWLFVEHTDENGQIITGWISAQYVVVTQFGRAFDIKSIPLPTETPVGEVIPAGGSSGAVSSATSAPIVTFAPPPAGTTSANQIIGLVVNLNPGANLNLRDRPSADGLVVRPIPANAQILVLGRNGDGTWLNVQYDISGEPTAIGWVTAQFISVTQNGVSYSVKSLPITNGEDDTMVE